MNAFAQSGLSNYEAFKRASKSEYSSFHQQANQAYADFVRQSWELFSAKPAIPRPNEKTPLPPLPYGDADHDSIISIEVSPILIDAPMPQPLPNEPVKELPDSYTIHCFTFFGTPMQVRLNEDNKFNLISTKSQDIANAWQSLSNSHLNNLIRDCLELRIRHNLNDWAYLKMLDRMSQSFFGQGCNEATLLMAYLFCQTGYQMRLANDGTNLYMLFGSKHQIFDLPYFKIDGISYYPYNCKAEKLRICNAEFPYEMPLSLIIDKPLLLTESPSDKREIVSERFPDLRLTVSSNKNLIDFYNSYPTSAIGDFMSRWAMYANVPMAEGVKASCYSSLKASLLDSDQLTAVNKLLNLVQTGFVYEYDDKVWGHDRAFFPEETLYYPYCDCEDRSILFSRLVRDIVGLDVALVYYPGHLATAVNFANDVTGDHIMIEREKYVVCDPTYIGAPVGKSMPDLDYDNICVIKLKN